MWNEKQAAIFMRFFLFPRILHLGVLGITGTIKKNNYIYVILCYSTIHCILGIHLCRRISMRELRTSAF